MGENEQRLCFYIYMVEMSQRKKKILQREKKLYLYVNKMKSSEKQEIQPHFPCGLIRLKNETKTPKNASRKIVFKDLHINQLHLL